MVRLILLCLLALPAAADCLPADKVTSLTYDDGLVIEGLHGRGRWRQGVVRWTTGAPVAWTWRDGILPAKALRDGSLTEWHWTGRLDLDALQPGQTVTLSGDEQHGQAKFAAEFKVTLVRQDSLTVAGCTYPVQVLVTLQTTDVVSIARQDWVWQGLPLRREVLEPQGTPVETVTAIR